MGLVLDSECQSAVDVAKSALAEGMPLDVVPLLDALYHSTQLKERLPELAAYFEKPTPRRPPPDKVPLAERLRPLLGPLVRQDHPVTAREMFLALVKSEPGQEVLRSRGISAEQLARVERFLESCRHTQAVAACSAGRV